MKHLLYILLLVGAISCQVLDEREVPLSKTFCKNCQKPLKELMLKAEGIYVVKYQDDNKLFYNYDADLIDVDSLENELMRKGYLPRKDSIVMYPVCCNEKPRNVEKPIEKIVVEEVVSELKVEEPTEKDTLI